MGGGLSFLIRNIKHRQTNIVKTLPDDNVILSTIIRGLLVKLTSQLNAKV